MKNFVRILFLVMLMAVFSHPPAALGQFFFIPENSLIGKPAPDFTLKTTSGQKKNMTAYRQEKNAIIFFWATWCQECKKHIKQVSQQQEDIERAGIKMILVNIEEREELVQDYLKKKGIEMDVFLDQWIVTKESFSGIVEDTEGLFLQLSKAGYVNQKGYVQEKFNWIKNPSDIKVSIKDQKKREAIFEVIYQAHLSESYQIFGLPSLFLVNKKGIIQDVMHQLPDNYSELFQESGKPVAEDGGPIKAVGEEGILKRIINFFKKGETT